ncbi:MAG: cytochrome C [Flavobacteriia bacterium]|nr:cytochrome C [Flavobacteriia bacterium]
MIKRFAILFFLVGSFVGFAQFSPGELSEAHKHLEGTSNCTQCHSIGAEINDTKCLECHTEISSLIDDSRGYHSSNEVQQKTCIDCHSEHHGRRFDAVRFDTDKFDHNLTGYELEGAHDRIECRDCHISENIADSEIAKRKDTYLGLDEACLSCHTDYHQGTLPVSCTDCHTMEEWSPAAKFDHAETEFPLRGSHANVDCIECHKESVRNGEEFQEFANVPFSKCTDCHTDVHNGRFGTRCTDCHTEQSWLQLKAGNRFDHNLTDYPLEGLHAEVSCVECHKGNSYSQSMAHANCLDCHDDYHEGDFTLSDGTIEDCASCHTVARPFTYSSYSIDQHQQSQYPLEGAHLATPCFACHQTETQEWEFSWESTDCITCHANIHDGFISEKYYPGQNCEACHNPETWSSVAFDHSQTDWLLEGAHAEVGCAECHWEPQRTRTNENQVFIGSSMDCASCHDNPHGTQFEVEGTTDCIRCHTVDNAWNISSFDHSTTQFPLTGQHSNVECKECHYSEADDNGEERVVYKIPQFECVDCHGT